MARRVIVAGLLAGLALGAWNLAVNGILGLRARVDMNQIPAEREVYEVLKQSIVEPGRYIVNPELTPSGFPADQPVFSVLYGGVGHEAAGTQALVALLIALLGPVVAAGMLATCSRETLESYPRKLLFVAAIGLLGGLFGHLMSFGIGDYPLGSAAVLALQDLADWVVVGLVLAWRIRPLPAAPPAASPTVG